MYSTIYWRINIWSVLESRLPRRKFKIMTTFITDADSCLNNSYGKEIHRFSFVCNSSNFVLSLAICSVDRGSVDISICMYSVISIVIAKRKSIRLLLLSRVSIVIGRMVFVMPHKYVVVRARTTHTYILYNTFKWSVRCRIVWRWTGFEEYSDIWIEFKTHSQARKLRKQYFLSVSFSFYNSSCVCIRRNAHWRFFPALWSPRWVT